MGREIGQMDPNGSKDASGPKHMAIFIVNIAELMPKVLLPYISLIIPHLADEAYQLRNGIIQALGHIICNGFEKDDDRDDTKHRDQFLEILEERFLDTTSYTRSKVIQTWIMLVKGRFVPLKFILSVTDAALGRLEDKAAQVRKNAINLLCALLEFNPFAGDLRLKAFTAKLEAAEATLEAIRQKKKETNNVPPPAKEK